MRVDFTGRKLLILDLDETLFFATPQPLSQRADLQMAQYFVYLRPHVREFLTFCLQHFTVAIWTAATPAYAQAMLAHLFPDRTQLAFVWTRVRCTYQVSRESEQVYWRKDVKKVKRKGYDLCHVLAVDDTSRNYERSYGNLISVRPFFGMPEDDELLRLIPYLNALRTVENVRTIEKRNWRQSR